MTNYCSAVYTVWPEFNLYRNNCTFWTQNVCNKPFVPNLCLQCSARPSSSLWFLHFNFFQNIISSVIFLHCKISFQGLCSKKKWQLTFIVLKAFRKSLKKTWANFVIHAQILCLKSERTDPLFMRLFKHFTVYQH